MRPVIATLELWNPLTVGAVESHADDVSRWVAMAIAVVGVACLARRRPTLRGTTLVAVWWWSLAALAAVAAIEFVAPITAAWEAAKLPALRYLAAMGTFCPLMALLGAKRPQDRGWQFIVFTLWVVLSLPGFEWLLWGEVRELDPVRLGFVAMLIAIGAINGTMTREWPASLLTSLGQALLLAPFFSANLTWPAGARGPLTGLAALVAAEAVRLLTWPAGPRHDIAPLDLVWRDFRDAYGLVWGLRIAERMNTSATMYDWPVMLAWRGFVPRDKAARVASSGVEQEPGVEEEQQIPPVVEDSLRTLLRRFVSADWIDGRMGTNVRSATETTTFASDSSQISAD